MSGTETTLNLLLELYHESRNRREWATLSLETRDGMEFMPFSLNMAPGGTPARGSGRRWQPVSGEKKRKTPSQLRRDHQRKQEFIAKKRASLDNTGTENSVEKECCELKEASAGNPKDVEDAIIADTE